MKDIPDFSKNGILYISCVMVLNRDLTQKAMAAILLPNRKLNEQNNGSLCVLFTFALFKFA